MGRKNSKKKKKEKRSSAEQTMKGRLDITRSGMGFVIVENEPVDILVRRNDFNTALHGDVVRVRILKDKGGRRMQGAVSEVLQRKQTQFMGRLDMNDGFAFFIAESDKPM